MVAGSLFYASDKAVFDALIQRKITNSQLAELFFERGIVISKNTSREELAKYFSRNIHDYYDHQFISKIFGSSSKKEKTITKEIKNEIDTEDIETVVADLCTSSAGIDEIFNYESTDDGYQINIKYKEVDYSKAEFRQVVQKEATITLNKEFDGWTIRSPLNDYIEDVNDSLLDKISTQLEESDELNVERIEFVTMTSNELRKSFFDDKLIKGILGYSLYDVTDVNVYNPDSLDDGTDIHISKASLKGKGVLESAELKGLYDKKFYIWKINWKIRKNDSSDIIEIEAQFSDAENYDKFSYVIKGYYKNISQGEYNTSKTNLSKEEELKYSKLLDSAAKRIMSSIKAEFTS